MAVTAIAPLTAACPPVGRSVLDPQRILRELRRLAHLIPGVSAAHARDLIPFAVAYARQYQDDIPQLELGASLLVTAHAQTWEHADPAATVALTGGLLPLLGRVALLPDAERILRRGIEASLSTGDRRHRAYFQVRLGGLRYMLGDYHTGWSLWLDGLRTAAESEAQPVLWSPFTGFIYLADMLGSVDLDAAGEAVMLIREWEATDPMAALTARFAHGFFARHRGVPGQAREDFIHCLHSLAERGPCAQPAQQIFRMAAQIELARLDGDYPRARELAEITIALARLHSDWYTTAILLIDQAIFAHQMGRDDDIPAIAGGLADMTAQVAAPCALNVLRAVSQWLGASKSTMQGTRSLLSPVESLSAREHEVLRLVAQGFTNCEVAARLIISPTTVKKHLEHIYTKLGTHSRTAAVARARDLALLP